MSGEQLSGRAISGDGVTDPRTVEPKLHIALSYDGAGHNLLAAAYVGEDCVATSGWQPTAEGALIACASKCRELHRELSTQSWRSVMDDGKVPTVIALARAGLDRP